jgi:hypothetical protein
MEGDWGGGGTCIVHQQALRIFMMCLAHDITIFFLGIILEFRASCGYSRN